MTSKADNAPDFVDLTGEPDETGEVHVVLPVSGTAIKQELTEAAEDVLPTNPSPDSDIDQNAAEESIEALEVPPKDLFEDMPRLPSLPPDDILTSEDLATSLSAETVAEIRARMVEQSRLQHLEDLRVNVPKDAGNLLTKNGQANFEGQVVIERQTSEDDDPAEGERAAEAFASIREAYEAKRANGQAEVEDEVHFISAQTKEQSRLRALEKKRKLEAAPTAEEDNDDMFFPEETDGVEQSDFPREEDFADFNSVQDEPQLPQRRNRIPPVALAESMAVGREEDTRRKRGRPKKGTSGQSSDKTTSKDRVTKSKPKSKKPRSRKAKKGENSLDQILGNLRSNVVMDAYRNRGREAQPLLKSGNKQKALAELIASIPEDHRDTAVADKNTLLAASRDFDGVGACKTHADGSWKIRGLKTPLFHYQMLGVCFMRRRENENARPHGGICGDEMGLGKTVMMIANIINGYEASIGPKMNKTTLIVVPPALVNQWYDEIQKHKEPKQLLQVMIYRAGSRFKSSDEVSILCGMDIIITTYNEICRSYPQYKEPETLVTQEAKDAWWAEEFRTKRGPLHQIYFRRIVLDECQLIKNPFSSTSKAVRGLNGKYRWALSGTPIQNSLEEFYPYFSFLKVEHTGSLDLFKRNFLKRGSEVAMKRLHVFLRKVMIRRTHLDELFGRPILKLPNLSEDTKIVDFNPLEAAVYKIIKDRFYNKILDLTSKGPLEKSYRSIYILYLRLRQMTGHIFLIQKTLEDFCLAEDFEKLWKLADDEQKLVQGGVDRQTLKNYREILKNAAKKTAEAKKTDNEQKSDNPLTEAGQNDLEAPQHGPQDVQDVVMGDTEETAADREQTLIPSSKASVQGLNLGGEFGRSYHFKEILKGLRRSDKWEEINQRSMCNKCGEAPTEPHLTSCMHMYCKGCIDLMMVEAMEENPNFSEMPRAKCVTCDIVFDKATPCELAGEFADSDTTGSPTPDNQTKTRGRKKSPKSTLDQAEESTSWLSLPGAILPSAKTIATKAQILAWLTADPTNKIIVFTQFRGLITVLKRLMAQEHIGCEEFHGAQSFEARDRAIQRFSDDADVKVLLASLKAGGVGLNLTAASKVIIIDLWWNSSVEAQAFCRVFRIGQTRDVEVVRFVVRNSIDVEIVAMQKRKDEEIEEAIGGAKRGGKLTTAELIRLFGPLQVDEVTGEVECDGVEEPFIFVEDEAMMDDKSDDEANLAAAPRPF